MLHTSPLNSTPLDAPAACFTTFQLLLLFRRNEGTKQPVHENEVLAVIVLVRGVVDGVVACSHDGLDSHVDAVVDARGPYGSCEEQEFVGYEVHGDEEEEGGVGAGLEDAVECVEGKTWWIEM